MDINKFSVTIFGNVEKYNETISKARCRIFYKGENRNGSYISDEFAEKLLATVPYAPIKGIYNSNDQDYTDHGNQSDEGRIYGVVPENPNIDWESHQDEDGITREYACVDVYLFTAIYKEASEIINKSQSMEIYSPSIRGEWVIQNGKRLFRYTEGCFLGLQVLGEDVEPCFEGAAFFNLYDNIVSAFQKIEKMTNKKNTKIMGGHNAMNFKLAFSQIEEAIWNYLNPNYTKEGDWIVDYYVYEIYDNYAVVRKLADSKYERLYYTKNENDELVFGEKVECKIVDVTETEYTALQAIQSINNNSFEAIDIRLTEAENNFSTLNQEKIELEQKVEENNNTISTLTMERDTFSTNLEEANNQINGLQEELEELKNYKIGVEKKEKEAIINKYSNKLSDKVLDEYREKVNDFSAFNLERELAFLLVTSTPKLFSNTQDDGLVPKPQIETGVEALLKRFQGLKNN